MARKSLARKSRPSKMGRKWTQDDVLAYNITVVYEDLTTFFGVTDLPSPDVEIGALISQDAASAKSYRATYIMLRQMSDLMNPDEDPVNRVPNTIDFVKGLFDVIYYADVLKKRFTMRPKLNYMESQGRPPLLDICIRDDSKAILLVVKADRHSRGFDPEPRLISDAIGAFQDNVMRAKHLGTGTNALPSKIMPGIVMDGTMPTFYKIPITAELVRAVAAGERPEQETIIHAYRPEVPRPEEGMKPLDNRHIILSCFSSFRQFL